MRDRGTEGLGLILFSGDIISINYIIISIHNIIIIIIIIKNKLTSDLKISFEFSMHSIILWAQYLRECLSSFSLVQLNSATAALKNSFSKRMRLRMICVLPLLDHLVRRFQVASGCRREKMDRSNSHLDLV